MRNAKEFASQVGLLVRDYLARQLAPLQERLNTLEARPGPERGQAGPPGADGRDGIDGKDGAPGVNGKDGAPGIDGRDAAPGERGERGAEGIPGRDGMHGRDGAPGRDGKDGADGFGFDDLSCVYDGERTLTLRFTKGERVRDFPLVLPIPLDRGVWRDGAAHARGDGVTHGGSWWLAQRGTSAKPAEGEDWRLAVRKGRDGKDGERGVKGEPGTPGRAGRDLTNLGADGSKWA